MIELVLGIAIVGPILFIFVFPTVVFVAGEIEQGRWARRMALTRNAHIQRMVEHTGDQKDLGAPPALKRRWKMSRIAAAVGIVYAVLLVFLVIQANVAISGREVLAPEAEAPGRFVVMDGHRLHVATRGDVHGDPSGAPLLLIHGFATPGHATFLPWAEKLTPKRALILPDLLGYGFSERITVPGPYYGQKGQTAAVAAMLDDLGVAQVDVVGHSYGGVIAAQFAIDYPERVRRIIFMDAAIYFPPSRVSEAIIQAPLGIGRTVFWHGFGGGPLSIVSMFCKTRPDCPWMPPTRIKDTTDAVRATMYSQRHYTEGAFTFDDIAKITAPALVLWGEDDILVPVRDGYRLADALKAPLALVPGAKHMPYLQKPDAVADWVMDFLTPPP